MLKPLMQAGLAAAAGITVRREERLTGVRLLTGVPGKLRVSSSSLSSSSLSQGGFSSGAEISGDSTAEELRGDIEMALGKTVLLDNPPAQRFAFKLQWDPKRPGDFDSALADQLGLRLEPVRRLVPFLVVDTLDSRPAWREPALAGRSTGERLSWRRAPIKDGR